MSTLLFEVEQSLLRVINEQSLLVQAGGQALRPAWNTFPFDLHQTDPSMLSHIRHQVLPPWQQGIQLNVNRMRELGLRHDLCDAIQHGFDLALVKPLKPVLINNYPSAITFGDRLEKRMCERVKGGHMQLLPDDAAPTVINPLAAIPKVGPSGLDDDIREIWDLTASGINEACKDKVM